MKKTIMERLGLVPVRRLNRSICLERVRKLQARLRAGDVPKALEEHADYYRRWYSWMARNGGTRAKVKRSA